MLKENRNTTSNGIEGYEAKLVNTSVSTLKNLPLTRGHALFNQFNSNFFNEMRDCKTVAKESCQRIEQWLSQHTLDELKQLNQVAKQHFLYEGITFTVYGEDEGIERTIPYDLIPRVIARKEWNNLSLGCAQRVKALNLFLHDVYHQQDILKAGLFLNCKS